MKLILICTVIVDDNNGDFDKEQCMDIAYETLRSKTVEDYVKGEGVKIVDVDFLDIVKGKGKSNG